MKKRFTFKHINFPSMSIDIEAHDLMEAIIILESNHSDSELYTYDFLSSMQPDIDKESDCVALPEPIGQPTPFSPIPNGA